MANDVIGQIGHAQTVFASAARTATPNGQDFHLPPGSRAFMLTVDVTAVTSTPAVTFLVEGVDPVSGNTFPLLASASIATTNAATAVRTLSVGPGLPATANVAANSPLPRKIRVTATHGNANSITYSVGAYVS